jgi:hypothetical protein
VFGCLGAVGGGVGAAVAGERPFHVPTVIVE